MGRFIDFNYVKEHADIEAILTHYQIDTNGSGDERRCSCPFHDDENPSFSINIEDGKFHCHAASCGEKGNILDFVAAMEDTEDLRHASEVIGEICGIELAPPKRGKVARKRNGKATTRRGSSDAKRETKRVADKRELNGSASESVNDQSDPKTEAKPNSPLDFRLNLDQSHEYGASRSLSSSEIERFEMGYCTKGTMKDRWCIPYHNAGGELIGYIGRAIDENDDPKYKLPKGFNKNAELFNLHRVAGHSKHVTLVEGVFDAIKLHGLSMPAVALIGTSISEQQIELLVHSGFRSVTVIFDNDAPDLKTKRLVDKAEADIVLQLSRQLLVRSVELPEGTDPATAPEEFLRGRVPVFHS